MRQEFGKGQTGIAGKGPAKPGLPRMARDQTPNARRDDQRLQHNSARRAPKRLIEQCQDRDKSRRSLQILQTIHAEEEPDGEEPRRDEADGNGAHDGDGDHFFRAVDLLREMGGAVEAGEGVIGVDEADDEGDAVGGPARVVDKIGKDEPGVLVRGRLGGDRDEDDEEGY